MQMNMKKMATAVIGSLMMGATLLGPASAAVTLGDYPAPFATVDGVNSVIVVGASAATEDVVGAINVGAKLAQAGATDQTVSVTCEAGAATVSGGVQVKSVATNLYINNALNAVLSRRITSSDLPTVLADGIVSDSDQTETKYTQQLILGANKVLFGKPTSDVTTPILYLDVPTTTNISTTKVVFENAVNYTKLAGKTINILGKDYTFSSAAADLLTTRLVLYGGGEKVTVDAGGAEKTVTLEGKTVTLKMTSWTSANEAVLTVNGVTDTYAQGSYISISGFDSKVYVKKVTVTKTPSSQGGAGESAYAELFVGSDKLVLGGTPSGSVKAGKNEDSIQGSDSTVTTSAITVTYAPTEQKYVEAGKDFTEPVFKAVKFSFTGIDPVSDASSREAISVKQDGSANMALIFPSASGAVTLPFAHFDGTNSYLADKSNYSIQLVEGTNILKNQYFVIGTEDTGSKVMQVTNFDVGSTANKTTIKDVATGTSTTYTYNAADPASNALYISGIPFLYTVAFNAAIPGSSTMLVDMNGTGGIAAAGITPIYTKLGAKIGITTVNATTGAVQVNVTEDGPDRVPDATFGDQTTVVINSAYSTTNNRYGIAAYGANGVTAAKLVGSAALVQVGDTYVYKGMTQWGTPVELSGDSTGPLTLKLSYADQPAVAQVFVGEPGMVASTSASAGTTKTATVSAKVPAIPTAGISKLDSKVSDAEKLGKLILVGGPAVNTLVAELAASGKTMSADKWREADETGAKLNKDKAKIQLVEDAFGTGSVALVVAGYSAADTGNAAYVLQNYKTFASKLAGKTEVTVTGINVADVS